MFVVLSSGGKFVKVPGHRQSACSFIADMCFCICSRIFMMQEYYFIFDRAMQGPYGARIWPENVVQYPRAFRAKFLIDYLLMNFSYKGAKLHSLASENAHFGRFYANGQVTRWRPSNLG